MSRPTSPEALARKQLGMAPKRRNQASSAVARLERQAHDAGVTVIQDDAGRVSCLLLQGYDALSWNVLWRGTDHHARSRVKRAYSQPVADALAAVTRPIQRHAGPVTVTVRVYGRGGLVDPDNICVKPILDVLKGVAIGDDTGEDIAELRVRVRRSTEPFPYIILTLEAV